jgi:RHS repeat-associated protein
MPYIDQADGRRVLFNKQDGENNNRILANVANDGWLELQEETAIWIWQNGRKFHFNRDGRLSFIVSPTGKTIYLTYDSEERLIQVTDPQDRSLVLDYYPNNRIKAVLDPMGHRTQYTYDFSGNLLTAEYSDNTLRVFHYEDSRFRHNLTGITDGRGIRFATWAYDDKGRAILSTHANDIEKVTLKYEKGKTLVTNSKGVTSTYYTEIRNHIPLVTRVDGPGCSACGDGDIEYEYNDRIQLTSIRKKDGITVRYLYDEIGRTLQVSKHNSAGISKVIAKYAYKVNSMKPMLITEPSINSEKTHQWWLKRNEQEQITAITEIGYTPDFKGGYLEVQRTTEYEYEDGKLVAIDGPAQGKSDRFVFNEQAYLSSRKNKSYDSNGRIIQNVMKNGDIVALNYDTRGRLISYTTTKMNGDVNTIQMKYDANGQLISLAGPNGNASAEYDAAGRLTTVVSPTGERQEWMRDTEGVLLSSKFIDTTGRLEKHLSYHYDKNGRIGNIEDQDGNMVSYKYNTAGRIIQQTDPLGFRTKYDYGSFGRLQQRTIGVNSVSEIKEKIEYDIHGNIVSLIDGRGNASHQQYDDLGHRLYSSNPDTGVIVYRYNAKGQVIARVDESGLITRFDYDTQGRLTGMGAFNFPTSQTMVYENGLPVAVNGYNQQTKYSYDNQGRVKEKQISLKGLKNSFKTGYRYDDKGRIKEKYLPDGQSLVYNYSEKGQVSSIDRKGVIFDSKIINQIQFNEKGRLSNIAHANEKITQFTYDKHGWLSGINSDNNPQVNYEYDYAGKLTSISTGDKVNTYSYDELDRLVSAAEGDMNYRWNYDNVGNRISQKQNGQVTTYTYSDQSNRLLRVGNDMYSYNRTGAPITSGDLRYEYTLGGRLFKVYRKNKLIAEYHYNSDGERIQKINYTGALPVSSYFLYENKKLVAEVDQHGNITSQYLYVGPRPVARLQGEKIYAIHTDHRNAPISVTDVKGKTVWSANYNPFGEASLNKQQLTLNLRLPGQYYDKETGHHYNVYRDYDPKTGRYLTSDPLGTKAGFNTYAYVKNDPLNRVDPLGLYDAEVHYYMTFFLARIAGISEKEADTIASAAQYIDDNFLTSPFTGGDNALEIYHFTLDKASANDTNINDPLSKSKQLQRLRNAAVQDNRSIRGFDANDNVVEATYYQQTDPNKPKVQRFLTRCAKAQLYGEFLHAFEDSFSHRNKVNKPYSKWNTEGIYYHTFEGHTPDKTFNSLIVTEGEDPDMDPLETEIWKYNQQRTLQMEKEVFKRLINDFGDNGAQDGGGGNGWPKDGNGDAITWDVLTGGSDAWVLTGRILDGYPVDSAGRRRDDVGNIIDSKGIIIGPADEKNGAPIQWERTCDTTNNCKEGGVLQQFNRARTEAEKIDILETWLFEHGYTTGVFMNYNKSAAAQNRANYLNGLQVQNDFNGVLLPTLNEAACIGGSFSTVCP